MMQFNSLSRHTLSLSVIAIAALASACAPKVDTAKVSFCEDLNQYAAKANDLNGLTENATVEDYKKAQAELEKAADKLADSSKALNRAENKAMSESKAEFARAVNSISDKDTLSAANAQIKQASAKLIKDYLEVSKTVCTYTGK